MTSIRQKNRIPWSPIPLFFKLSQWWKCERWSQVVRKNYGNFNLKCPKKQYEVFISEFCSQTSQWSWSRRNSFVCKSGNHSLTMKRQNLIQPESLTNVLLKNTKNSDAKKYVSNIEVELHELDFKSATKVGSMEEYQNYLGKYEEQSRFQNRSNSSDLWWTANRICFITKTGKRRRRQDQEGSISWTRSFLQQRR